MASLVKTVEMRVLAKAGDADRQLDELDAKAKALDGNAIKMRFRIDDAEGRAQLDAIQARAKTMGFEDVRLKVKVDGAGRAIAELEAIKHEEDQIRGTGIMNRIGGLFSSGVGAAGNIPFVGGLAGAGGGIGLAALIPLIGAVATEITGVVAGFAAAGAGAGAFALLAIPAVKQVEGAYQNLGKAQQAYVKAQEKEQLDPTKANKSALATAGLNLRVAQEQIAKLPASEQAAVRGIQGLVTEFGKMSRAFQPQAFKVFADGLKVVGNLMPHITPFASTFAQGLDKLLQQAAKFTQSKGFENWLKQFHSLEGPAIQSIGQGIANVANSFGKLMTIMSGKDVAHTINIAFGAISGTINAVASGLHTFMQNFDGMKSAATSAVRGVEGAFKGMVGTVQGVVSGVVGAWKTMAHGIEQGVAGAVAAARALPGKIKAVFAGAAGWLIGAGRDIVAGLARGIGSAVGAAVSAAEHVASSVVGAVKGFLHIGSPSKVMHTIGQQTVQGLITGLQGGQSALNAAATALGNTVAGPDAAISKAVAKLMADVPHGDTALTRWLKADEVKLQGLAKQRQMLEQEIQLSQQVAQNEISSNSIMNAAGAGPDSAAAPVATSQLISGMQFQVAQVKAFTAAIKELKREGLNATSLSQIIGAGSGQGLPVAQALLQGGKGAVQQVNALQKQLKTSAGQLGDAAAGPMYQAGVQAAQGLAKGIKSQLGAVSAAMKQLAEQMVKDLKHALKIRSPSLVFAAIGAQIPAGLALGIGMNAGAATSASAHLAAATVRPWSGTGGAGGGGGDVHIHFGVVGDPQAAARQVVQVLRQYKRTGGGAPLGIA